MGTSSAEYRVSLLPERHELLVELILRGDAATGEVRLSTPTWVPGAYGFTTIARDLFDVHAEDAGSGCRSGEGFDPFHQRVARVDVHAGLAIGEVVVGCWWNGSVRALVCAGQGGPPNANHNDEDYSESDNN